MEKKIDKEIEDILTSIEFPGESDTEISKYLDKRDFTNLVIKAVEDETLRNNKKIFWFIFTILNIILLSLLGTNQFITNELFALHDALATIFYFFLGVTVLGGLIGLIGYIDTEYLSHLPDEIGEGINRVKNRFFGN